MQRGGSEKKGHIEWGQMEGSNYGRGGFENMGTAMPSGPITQAGSMPDRTFSTFSGEKDGESSRQWVCWGKMGDRKGWFGYVRFEGKGRVKIFCLISGRVCSDAV